MVRSTARLPHYLSLHNSTDKHSMTVKYLSTLARETTTDYLLSLSQADRVSSSAAPYLQNNRQLHETNIKAI